MSVSRLKRKSRQEFFTIYIYIKKPVMSVNVTSEPEYRRCVPPCTRFITRGDSHQLCVACLGMQHAQSALEGVDCEHCERFPLRTLRSRRSLFEESGLLRAPRGSGPASVEAERRRLTWGSQMDLTGDVETGSALSQPSPAGSSASLPALEARTEAATFARVEAHDVQELRLSSSEELDVESFASEETGDSSRQHTSGDHELMNVLSRAVEKLSIEWPADRQESIYKSKLDDRFLSAPPQPSRRCLPFFPDLHTEVSKTWASPVSSRIYTPQSNTYGNICGAKTAGYITMPKPEETLASYLSPVSSSSLNTPALPSRPLKNTSVLVGKAYSAAGQAAACLHTMAIMQAYQANLLKEASEGGQISMETINEHRQSADLTLRATKGTAKSIGRSMAALVATERHLWLSQTSMKEKDKSLLLNAPMSLTGLFGDTLHSVTERFQEEKKHAAAFHKFIPLKVRIPGDAERGQS